MPIIVNGETITDKEIQDAREQLKISQVNSIENDDISDDLLNDMLIDRVLIRQKAQVSVKELPPGALRRKIKTIIDERGGEQAYKKMLETLEIEKSVFEKDIESGIKIDTFLDDLCKDIPEPADDEVLDYFKDNSDKYRFPESIKVMQIVKFKQTVLEVNHIMQEMKEVLQAINDGASFLEMLRAHSDRVEDDGIIGPFPRDVMTPDYDEAVFDLNPEEVSDLIVTQYGIFIVKMLEKFPSRIPEFSEVSEYVKNDWHTDQENIRIDALAKELRLDAVITID